MQLQLPSVEQIILVLDDTLRAVALLAPATERRHSIFSLSSRESLRRLLRFDVAKMRILRIEHKAGCVQHFSSSHNKLENLFFFRAGGKSAASTD